MNSRARSARYEVDASFKEVTDSFEAAFAQSMILTPEMLHDAIDLAWEHHSQKQAREMSERLASKTNAAPVNSDAYIIGGQVYKKG